MPPIGGHVSTAGGLAEAPTNAKRIGAQAIQFFGASPRQWNARLPDVWAVAAYKKAYAASGVSSAFLHAAYLVNLASPSTDIRAKSVQSLAAHLRISELLESNGLIFHIGSGKELPKETALTFVVENIKKVLKDVPGRVKLIIENAAGGGQKLGAAAAEIGAILDAVASPRLAVCFDTAHAFEAGVVEAYRADTIAALCDEWDRAVGLERIVALHINDSKSAFNSHYDRHENIGEGHLGIESFRALAREPRLRDKAWLLEVPGFSGAGPDAKNIAILKSCFTT